jgi:hypothetical protein
MCHVCPNTQDTLVAVSADAPSAKPPLRWAVQEDRAKWRYTR